ncbi:EscG/YscG/SsaH family type III secretion system needle protein co-chaperone [Caballeronia sp. EK]|nr:EscG/YscG/SsaH family type III secretion system needle protein co-chaperone [Caballeronia sp. EK]
MRSPSPDVVRLIVETGFAAVNHGLRPEIRDILAAVPDLVNDSSQVARVEAILLFGLGHRRAAAARLTTLDVPECGVLRAILKQP